MLPEHGPIGIPNYEFSFAPHRDQWADIHHAPALTTLQAFCTDSGRRADCVCVHFGHGDVVLDCNGYLGAYPALERCFRHCECEIGGPQGRRMQGELPVVNMNLGRTTVQIVT